MKILDEDISAPTCERLRAYKIHFRQIGVSIGRAGMKDREDIIPLLHRLKSPTFFTLDHGFYHPNCSTKPVVWFFLMCGTTKSQSMFAVFYATLSFAPNRNV